MIQLIIPCFCALAKFEEILLENYFFQPKEVCKMERIVAGWNVIGNRRLIERKEDCRRSKSKEEDSSIHLC